MPDGIEVRRLAEADAPELWKLRLEALESDPRAFGESAAEHRATPLEAYAERLASGSGENVVFGAFDGGTLVGMVGVYRQQRLKRRHLAGIWGMFVRSEWRGRGVGQALVARALDCARGFGGVRQVQLSVIVTQTDARALYEAAGFRSYGIQPGALEVEGEYIDEDHMYCPLAP